MKTVEGGALLLSKRLQNQTLLYIHTPLHKHYELAITKAVIISMEQHKRNSTSGRREDGREREKLLLLLT